MKKKHATSINKGDFQFFNVIKPDLYDSTEHLVSANCAKKSGTLTSNIALKTCMEQLKEMKTAAGSLASKVDQLLWLGYKTL